MESLRARRELLEHVPAVVRTLALLESPWARREFLQEASAVVRTLALLDEGHGTTSARTATWSYTAAAHR